MFSKQADHHMVVMNHAGHLLSTEQTLVHGSWLAPVEHTSAVIVVADQVWLCVQTKLLVYL